MPSNNLLVVCALSLAFLSAHVGAQAETGSPRQDSIQTVNELLRVENARAVQNAQKEAVSLGLASGPAMQTPKSTRVAEQRRQATFAVDAVSGVGDQLRADITYDGQRYDGVSVGTKVGPCVVESIRGKKVTLSLKGKASGSGQCPAAEWTGVGRTPDIGGGSIEASINGAGSRPLPGIVPMPSGGVPPSGLPAPMPAR